MNLHHVLEAVGVLVCGLLFYSYTYAWFPASRDHLRFWRAALNGVAFGAIAVVLMIARIEIAPGVYMDARVVPVALIGLFEGWPAAFMAATIAAAYRAWLGGSGATAGILTLVLSGLAAGLLHTWARQSGRVGPRHVLLLVGLTFAATVAGFASLGRRGIDLFTPVWLSYLVTIVAGIGGLARLLRDVGEQHELAAVQRRYRESLDEAADVIQIIDADSLRILDTNRADSALSGYSRAEILARTLRDFWPDDPKETAAREAIMADLRARGHAQALAVGYRTRSGEVVPVDVTYRLFTQGRRRYGIVIFHPAGARIAAAAAEREAAELRTATLLARGAAHEIHNPLAVILGYLQLMRPRLVADSKEMEWVKQMLEATSRIREAVDRLTRLTRIESTAPAGLAPAMLDIHRSTAPGADVAAPTPREQAAPGAPPPDQPAAPTPR